MRLNLFASAARGAALILLSAPGVAAQVAQVSGTVTLKRVDGSVVPIEGALVDIYRTDLKQKFQATTDSRGAYLRAGIPFMGTYTIAVSAPGARPDYRAGVRVAQQAVHDFALVPGDGSRLSLEQIAAVATAPAGESPQARAAPEELERKNNELKEQNAKIEHENEAVSRTFIAGNAALNAGHVEEAIAQYREGLAVRHNEPALLTNLSEALRRRGVDRYNAAIKEQDNDRRKAGLEAGKQDWAEAAQLSRQALDIIDRASPTDPAERQTYAQNRRAALLAYAEAMRFVATKVQADGSQARAAWDAYQRYLAVETAPAKKAKLRGEALQMLFDAGAVDMAVAEARKALAAEPNNLDALRILGLSLFASGDKKNYQESADFLQRYVDLAPDTDPLKVSAKESLDYLKSTENVKPRRRQSLPSQPRRRP